MKNKHLLFLCSFVLISCSSINSNIIKKDFKSGLSNLCSDNNKNTNDTKSVVYVPDATDARLPAPREDSKQIENSSQIYTHSVEILKDNMFLAVYAYPVPNTSKSVGKIFNQFGEEIVKRFEIADYRGLDRFKVITDKNLDHFFVVYSEKNIGKNETGFILRKFDLKGNKLKEIKIENVALDYNFKNISFSFDENGNNLILSWINLEYSHPVPQKPCPLFQSCVVPAIVPDNYFHPVANIVKFDDQLNHCWTRVGFEELIVDVGNRYLPYITKKRDKVIFPLSYEKVFQIDLKNNSLKNTYISSNMIDDREVLETIYTVEDNNNLYFFSRSVVYKTNSMLKVLNSKKIQASQVEQPYIEKTHPNSVNDDLENIYFQYFFNEQLDIFYKTPNTTVSTERSFTKKLGDKFLVIENDNYFKIVDNLTP